MIAVQDPRSVVRSAFATTSSGKPGQSLVTLTQRRSRNPTVTGASPRREQAVATDRLRAAIPNGGWYMRDRDRLVEVSDETATLVLSGTVSLSDMSSMRLACREIPARVRTLRLNLGDVDGLDA